MTRKYYINACIFESETRRFHSGFVCVQNGIITERGSMADLGVPSPGTRIVDLKGACMMPAFTDSHLHLFNYAIARHRLNLEGLDWDSVLAAIGKAAQDIPAGGWIRGRGWEVNRFPNDRFPVRGDLDGITWNHPAIFSSKDGHAVWLNSAAIKLLDLPDLRHMPSNIVFRDEQGGLSGVFLESAADHVIQKLPAPTRTELLDALRDSVCHLHSLGISAVHSFETLAHYNILRDLAVTDSLPLYVMAYIQKEDLPTALQKGLKSGDRTGMLTFGGLKLFADGALGSRSAWMYRPYPGEPDNSGVEFTPRQELNAAVREAAEHGIQTAIHAIGNRAVHTAVDVLSQNRRAQSNIPPRIEHLQLVRENELVTMQKTGITASVQPTHAMSDIEMAERLWKDQEGLRYPYRSLHTTGCITVFGSDAPIESPGPLNQVFAAVRRTRLNGTPYSEGWIPEERMSLDSALTAVTGSPAIIEGRGTERGDLRVGYSADFVILDGDPRIWISGEGESPQVQATYLAGTQVYSSLQTGSLP